MALRMCDTLYPTQTHSPPNKAPPMQTINITGWQIYKFSPETYKSKSPIFFAHATGIPAQSYSLFLKEWSQSEGRDIYTYDVRGFCETTHKFSERQHKLLNHVWADLYDDFEAVVNLCIDHFNIEAGPSDFLFSGHSQGGVSALMVAPRFSCHDVLLFDPVSMRLKESLLWGLAAAMRQRMLHPVGRNVATRRNSFESRAAAVSYFCQKPLFEGFTEESMLLYVNAAFDDCVGDSGGIELRTPADTEALLFRSQPIWMPKVYGSLDRTYRDLVKLQIIRASDQMMNVGFGKRTFHKLFKDVRIYELEGSTHMFPIQMHRELVKKITLL